MLGFNLKYICSPQKPTITELNAQVVIESRETACLQKLANEGENMRQIAFDNRLTFYIAEFNESA